MENRCVICLERLRAEECNSETHTLPCGHEQHTSCLVTWFRHPQSRSATGAGKCPVCRAEPPHDAIHGSGARGAEDASQHLHLTEVQLHRVLQTTLRQARRRGSDATLKRQASRYLERRKRLAETRRKLRSYVREAHGTFTELRRTSQRLTSSLRRAQDALGWSAAPLLARAGLTSAVFTPLRALDQVS